MQLIPELSQKIINPKETDAPLKMRDVIESGGVLAILGDRTGMGEKTVEVDFFGKPALLPAGPYYLASILNCPIYCFFGIRTGYEEYHSHVIKLTAGMNSQKHNRDESIRNHAQIYADILAEKASKHPDNWFNFFDFWANGRDAD